MALGVTVSLGWTAAKVAIPSITRLAVDRGIVKNQSGALMRYTLIMLGLALLSAICAGLRRLCAFTVSYSLETNLRSRLFAHLQRLHFAFHDEAQTGQLMATANTDLKSVENFITMVPITMGNLMTMVSITVILFLLDVPLAACALIALPLINFVARRFASRLYPEQHGLQDELAKLSGVVEETLSGVRVVKGFGAERRQREKFAAKVNDVYDRAVAAMRIRATFVPLLDVVPQIGLVAILWLGGHRVLDGQLSLGGLVAFYSYVLMLVWPLRSTGMLIAQGQRAAVAATRVDGVLATDPQIVDPAHPKRLPSHPRDSLAGGRPAVGAVRFEKVDFGYSTDAPAVLHGFDLNVKPGEAVAVVGGTGSGKTTVARLLSRFYDVTGGRIVLDGVDVRELGLGELRRAVGIVFEDTFLFTDSVRANIAFADPAAPAEAVERAARLSGAHEFVADLPDGYETVLAERGQSLSGGQRQRIAIARAILADPRVLILDDATSAVDPSKEHEIRAALAEVMRGRTTIVIAHRSATIALADRVVMLDEGRVAATGTHAELLATNERYREILDHELDGATTTAELIG